MKRLLAAILMILMAIQGCAMASGLGYFDDYAASWTKMSDAEWSEEGDVLTLEIDIDTTVVVCLRGDVVMAVTVEAPVGGDSVSYAYAAFDALGWLGEDALEALYNLYVDDTMTADGCVVYSLGGETREGFAICAEEDVDVCCWMPVHGGAKRHLSPNCSGMDIPWLVTEQVAKDHGFDRCQRCWK